MTTTRVTVFALVCSAWMFGCGVEPGASDDTQEIIDNLKEAGFPADDITVVDGVVYVGGDATVDLQASREMVAVDSNSQEQFRTLNVVDTSVIQSIIIRPAGSLTSSVLAGLREAVANYNDLALGISFSAIPEPCLLDPNCPPRPPYANIDLVINPATGGPRTLTAFPSGGMPGSKIAIDSRVAQWHPNLIKHVLTHQIGHAIGLRHSDFYMPSISCGSDRNDDGDAMGGAAVPIPGTPTTATPNGSVMNTCYPYAATATTGEFTASDVTALTTLY